MTTQPATCRDCGKPRRIVQYGRCSECLTFLDTCAQCGGDLRGHTVVGKADGSAYYDHRFVAQQRERVA